MTEVLTFIGAFVVGLLAIAILWGVFVRVVQLVADTENLQNRIRRNAETIASHLDAIERLRVRVEKLETANAEREP